ncbi:MAG TPA: T9SS type A sorting domain-containing protein, partial [bacterium]|nr:T9SS type A sorting domain-containing protein [bacterium]
NYDVNFFSMGEGTIYVDIIAPKSETEAKEVIFEEVEVQSTTVAVMEAVNLFDEQPPVMQVDNDGDGNVDNEVTFTLLIEIDTVGETIGPIISVSNDLVSIGDVAINTSNSSTFTISNTGDEALDVISIESDNPLFTVEPVDFPIAPGYSVTVMIKLSPDTLGYLSTNITITSNAGNTQTLTINAEGTGVEEGSQSFLQIVSPIGGEKWKVGSRPVITWQQENVSDIKIEYSTDGGANWNLIVTDFDASTGYFEWTVPDEVSSECKVRISGITQPEIFVESEDNFSIIAEKFVNLLSPSDGDKLYEGIEYEIRWEYSGLSDLKIEYSSNEGDTWKEIVASTSASYGSYLWIVPDDLSINCQVKISDVNDSSIYSMNYDFFEIAKHLIQINHSSLTVAEENAPLTINTSISGDITIENIILYYDISGRRVFDNSIEFYTENEVDYSAVLPAGVFTAWGLEYFIIARDVNANEVRIPDNQGFHSISAQIKSITSPEIVYGGSEQNAYRMISIPLYFNISNVFNQLNGRLPIGQSGTDWRLFRFPAGIEGPEEYPDIQDFSPGKAFWLITKQDFQIKTAEGTTLQTDEPFTFSLEPGWNDIANPWMFEISWDDMDNPSNANIDVLYTYEGEWSDPINPPRTLESWKGYSVRNLENRTVIIKLQPLPIQVTEKPAVTQDGEIWKLTLKAIAGDAVDNANHLGIHEDAEIEWDKFDHVEPPPIGEYVSVSFPHHDWKLYPYDYTVDFRPLVSTLSWDFNVKTNIIQETVAIQLLGTENLPEKYSVQIFDLDMEYMFDNKYNSFSFVSGNGLTERHFRLIVNDSDEPEMEENISKPERYITAMCYPNPFNTQTTIRYKLSTSGKVIISVFNAVGQQVQVYDVGQKDQGTYEIVFDAANLTSGIYFYHVDAGYASITGKMLYMK